MMIQIPDGRRMVIRRMRPPSRALEENMRRNSKLPEGWILRKVRPVYLYAAPFLVSLNLSRLPKSVWLWPGMDGSRAFLMLWTFLLLLLAWLADNGLVKRIQADHREVSPAAPTNFAQPSARVAFSQPSTVAGPNTLFFLAWSVPGMLLLNLAAIIHLYLSWYYAGRPAVSPSLPVLLLMAAGCVLWIYGRVLPRIPYGSIWGIRTKDSLSSAEAWFALSRRAAPLCLAAGAACLFAGTLLLI